MTYSDGTTEIRLGDSVMVRRFFFWQLPGVVSYIPGISRPHPEMQIGTLTYWAVTTASHVVARPFEIGRPAPKSIRFVARATGNENLITPDQELT